MQALNAVMMIFQTALRPLGPEALVELLLDPVGA